MFHDAAEMGLLPSFHFKQRKRDAIESSYSHNWAASSTGKVTSPLT